MCELFAARQSAERKGLEVIGLTSTANATFCVSLGCCHRLLTCEHPDQIPSNAAWQKMQEHKGNGEPHMRHILTFLSAG